MQLTNLTTTGVRFSETVFWRPPRHLSMLINHEENLDFRMARAAAGTGQSGCPRSEGTISTA
jgi:hypothetical protein